MSKKNHTIEFEKNAKSYEEFSKVQKDVAFELIGSITSKPKAILDIGCGSGAVYKNISWKFDTFVGIDSSNSMCKQHPDNSKTKIFCEDFDTICSSKLLDSFGKFDMCISSSSLQWSRDLEKIFENYKKYTNDIAFAIFTDKTFSAIYDITQRESFLPKEDDICRYAKEYWNAKIWKKKYRLYFDDNISKIRYINKSGISGGVEPLSYTLTKELIKKYPYKYLEFHVIFMVSNTCNVASNM